MSDIKLSDLGVGSWEKYQTAFAAIKSDKILDADEAELANHARALATYHVDHKGEDQAAAALLIHNLQFKRISERISAQAERQTEIVIWLTRGLLGLTIALLLLTVYLCYDAYARSRAPPEHKQNSAEPHEPSP